MAKHGDARRAPQGTLEALFGRDAGLEEPLGASPQQRRPWWSNSTTDGLAVLQTFSRAETGIEAHRGGRPGSRQNGVVRLRCVDLRRVIKERFGVDLDQVTIGRVLKELGFAHVSARPQHPEQHEETMADFKKKLRPITLPRCNLQIDRPAKSAIPMAFHPTQYVELFLRAPDFVGF
jgi:transposase